jgi:hypothetical protein
MWWWYLFSFFAGVMCTVTYFGLRPQHAYFLSIIKSSIYLMFLMTYSNLFETNSSAKPSFDQEHPRPRLRPPTHIVVNDVVHETGPRQRNLSTALMQSVSCNERYADENGNRTT